MATCGVLSPSSSLLTSSSTLSTMSSPDALLALRQAIKSKTSIKYSNASGPTDSLSAATHLVLSPSVSLPRSTPTRMRKPNATSTDPTSSPQDFFTLDAVYLAWLLKDAPVAEYMKQARENGLAVGFVSITERKTVVDWLEGRTNDLPSLVPVVCESKFHGYRRRHFMSLQQNPQRRLARLRAARRPPCPLRLMFPSTPMPRALPRSGDTLLTLRTWKLSRRSS